jgi:hypothetical protein
MKVLDLHCQHGHVFEGWFGSEQDFQDQLMRGLVECPMCGDANISKRITAARLNLSGAKEAAPAQPVPQASEAATSTTKPSNAVANLPPELQAAWLKMAKHVMDNTTDVGSNFASEARRIHEGQAPERAIRGQATREEAIELLEEGIGVMPLPIPEHLKGTLQ